MRMSDVELIGEVLEGMGDTDVALMGQLSQMDPSDLQEVSQALQGMNRPRAAMLARRMLTARAIDPNATLLRDKQYTGQVKSMAAINATLFTAGTATQTVPLAVTRPFKPKEPIVSSTLAAFFAVNNAVINGVDQLSGSGGGVPMAAFSEACLRGDIDWQTINPSSAMQLSITMIDTTVNRTLRLAFTGLAATAG